MTLILPQESVTTKLMRIIMYIPRHWNFCVLCNLYPLDLDKVFDSDTGEHNEDDELDKDDSIAFSSILVLKDDDEVLGCKE